MPLPSSLLDARVILIRHARSRFNHDWPPSLPGSRDQQYTREHHAFAVDPRYIDCELCDEGVDQCAEMAPTLAKIRDIKTVFISPMRRTLQTASLLFAQHPQREAMRFIVKPLLRENLCCSCDIPHHDFDEVLPKYEAMFPNLDVTTYMTERKHWHLRDLESELRDNCLTHPSSSAFFLKRIAETFP